MSIRDMLDALEANCGRESLGRLARSNAAVGCR
jgi:hypothetical protein